MNERERESSEFLKEPKCMAGNDSVSCWIGFIVVESCDIAILNRNTFLSE